jgi:hypothetical protein
VPPLDYYTHYLTIILIISCLYYAQYFITLSIKSIIQNARYYSYYSTFILIILISYCTHYLCLDYIMQFILYPHCYSYSTFIIKTYNSHSMHNTWCFKHFLLVVWGVRFRLNPPSRSLHINGPRQCPRVDKPHPASIASTLPAVAGCARKEVAKVVLNCSHVTNWHDRKFSQDILHGDDIKNGLFVVQFVYNLRSNRF